MRILIVGSTGKTGLVLLEKLAKSSHTVMGMVRTPAQSEIVEKIGATPVMGDLTKDISKAPRACDAVIFVAGSRGKDVEGVDYEGLCKMVDASESHGVPRFLYLGSINNGKKPEQFLKEMDDYYTSIGKKTPENLRKNAAKPGYAKYLKMKAAAEAKVCSCSMNYTIVRAGLLTLEPASHKINAYEGSMPAFGSVSRANVAECFISLLEHNDINQKIYTVLDGNKAISEFMEEQAEEARNDGHRLKHTINARNHLSKIIHI